MTESSFHHAPDHIAWHVGEALSLVMRHDVSLRGPSAVNALRRHLVGDPSGDDISDAVIDDLVRQWLVAHFPSMDSFSEADRPCRELLAEWLARRAAQYGEYLSIPPIPADVIAGRIDNAETEASGT